MKKTFKKFAAVALTAGMLVSSFASGIAAQEETKESKELKKGTVITDFKEIKDVSELEPGNTYFFSLEEYDAEGAVATLPDGQRYYSLLVQMHKRLLMQELFIMSQNIMKHMPHIAKHSLRCLNQQNQAL